MPRTSSAWTGSCRRWSTSARASASSGWSWPRASAVCARAKSSLREKEDALKRRLGAKMDDQLRDARREIDAVIEGLKARATVLREKGERRAGGPLSTGETGMARSEAHAALDKVGSRVKSGAAVPRATAGSSGHTGWAAAGPRRLACAWRWALRPRGRAARNPGQTRRGGRARQAPARGRGRPARHWQGARRARASVSIDLQPREGTSLAELNVVGCTVDEALTRAARFLDETMLTDRREVRIIHGHGTGQLRRALAAFLKEHPLVSSLRARAHRARRRWRHGGRAEGVALRRPEPVTYGSRLPFRPPDSVCLPAVLRTSGSRRSCPSASSPWCKSRCIRWAMHPASRRCSSLKYSRYYRSSRLAIRAPRPSRCNAGLAPRAASTRTEVANSEPASSRFARHCRGTRDLCGSRLRRDDSISRISMSVDSRGSRLPYMTASALRTAARL